MNITEITFTNTTCRCGCGAVLGGKKSRFAQGHDARFVSAMKQVALDSDKGLHAEVRLIDKSTDPATQSMESVQNAVETLGSTPLKDKLISGFRKAQGRAEDKKANATKRALAKENAKGRRTSAKKDEPAVEGPQHGADPEPLTDVAEVPGDLIGTSDVLDDTPPAPGEPGATDPGAKPVRFKREGKVRRGSVG